MRKTVMRMLLKGLPLVAFVALGLPASGKTIKYYHLDAVGSVRVVTDETGAVVERHDYLPFGEATTAEQRAAVQGQPCVDCGTAAPKMFADHKRALVKEYYETGKINETRMRDVGSVQPQCPTCSARQGAELSRYSAAKKRKLSP